MSHRGLASLAAAAIASCSAAPLAVPGGPDGGGVVNPDASVGPPDDAGGPSPNQALVRVANLSPVLGAIDFCLRPSGNGYFDGPKVSSSVPATDASDAGSGGVPFPGVSGYLQVPAEGVTDVAVVAAGDPGCSAPKLLGTVTLDPSKRVTIALMGTSKDPDAGLEALGLAVFVDDTQGRPDVARLRVIHAALGKQGGYEALGSVSVGLGWGSQVDGVAGRVDPRHAATPSNAPPAVDALGYHDLAPVAALSSLRFAALGWNGGPWATTPADLRLAATAVETAFLVTTGSAPSVLLCTDLPSGGGAPCELLPTK